MEKYTFVLDYKGGTYLKQAQALSIEEAFKVWTSMLREDLEIPEAQYLAEGFEGIFDEHEIPPVLMTGLDNVWCASALINESALAIVHVILSKWR